jgi:hypothetical protein
MRWRPWFWAAWLLLLLIAPVGLLAVDVVFPTIPSYPPPWPNDSIPERLAGQLFTVHMAMSVVAALAVPALIRGSLARLVALAGIIAWLGVVGLWTLFTVWDKTGKYF